MITDKRINDIQKFIKYLYRTNQQIVKPIRPNGNWHDVEFYTEEEALLLINDFRLRTGEF